MNRLSDSAFPSPSPSPSSSPSSSSSSSCSPLWRSSPWLLSSGLPTTIYVQLPDDRPYGALLQQTEIVYDQLLAERQRKLQLKIEDRRTQYREKYDQLMQTADLIKASEFERWATAALRQLKTQCSKELNSLREDYESKFVKMRISLEEQLMADDYSLNNTLKTSPQHQQPHHETMHLTNRY